MTGGVEAGPKWVFGLRTREIAYETQREKERERLDYNPLAGGVLTEAGIS